MSRWEQLFKNIQQDLKLYLYILMIITIFRIGFIVIFNSHLSEATTYQDILASLFYGLRISLKTAGLLTLPSLFLCTFLNLLLHNKVFERLRIMIGLFATIVLSILFYVRIPYYEQFHMSFNQILFNTFKDDTYALFHTIIQEYNLLLRLSIAFITIIILFCLLKRWMLTKTLASPHFSNKLFTIAFRTATIYIVWQFILFTRFAGSLTYAYDISWENSALTKDEFLNEAILDDIQALYRAYELHERLINSSGIDVESQNITAYASYLSGRDIHSNNLDDFMEKTAQGTNIKKPSHIFLIVAESYANWPLLPKHQNLGIADDMKKLIASEHAIYVPAFLPNGLSTISGINGIVSGLAEVNLYVNYQEQSFKEPYATALAPQLKKLGYNTCFWYAGPSSWERIKDFVLAQGFDHFFACGDFQSDSGNVWGSDDKYLFNAVSSHSDNGQPSFHVILTVSNHAPYTVDLNAEGFDEQTLINALPENLQSDKDLIKKLGHYWYASKAMSDFIRTIQKKYPDSLFVIVGDHADRVNLQPNPSMYERYAIPFLIYGQNITKDLLPSYTAGSHINITPTLIELIAPEGFAYYSVGESLTRNNPFGFNYGFWISNDYIGKIDDNTSTIALPFARETLQNSAGEELDAQIRAMRAVSWWRIKYGKEINATAK